MSGETTSGEDTILPQNVHEKTIQKILYSQRQKSDQICCSKKKASADVLLLGQTLLHEY